ncbi:MAG: chemotaxis protein MotB [Gammaproteobacteria bacterium]|jgi:chemotaxis protein MotB
MSAKSLLGMAEVDDSGGGWIVIFADMMTLILVFFILLYTLAEYEEKAYKNLVASVQVLDGDGNQISVIDYATKNGRNPEPLKAVEDMLGLNPSEQVIENLRPAIIEELESMIGNTDLSDSVDMSFNADKIILQIDGRYLFQSGKAELKDGARVIFANLGQLFRQHADYKIAISGHTDDESIETTQFPSNWELSAIRATTVLRYFIGLGLDPERMTATGYADFIPLVNNDTAENRARNRRVEFVLEKEKDV